jgi:hypothetical protein
MELRANEGGKEGSRVKPQGLSFHRIRQEGQVGGRCYDQCGSQ